MMPRRFSIDTSILAYVVLSLIVLFVGVYLVNPGFANFLSSLSSFFTSIAPAFLILFGTIIVLTSLKPANYIGLVVGSVLSISGIAWILQENIDYFVSAFQNLAYPILIIGGAIILILQAQARSPSIVALGAGILMIVAGVGFWTQISSFGEKIISFFDMMAQNPLMFAAFFATLILIAVLYWLSKR